MVGPKIGNVEKVVVFKAFLEVKGAARNLEPAATKWAGAVGGGRGRETLPLGSLFSRVWRVC